VARDVESFPDFMEDLQSLVVKERTDDGNRTVTEWVGLIREFKMTVKWSQEDLWDPRTYRDDFTVILNSRMRPTHSVTVRLPSSVRSLTTSDLKVFHEVRERPPRRAPRRRPSPPERDDHVLFNSGHWRSLFG